VRVIGRKSRRSLHRRDLTAAQSALWCSMGKDDPKDPTRPVERLNVDAIFDQLSTMGTRLAAYKPPVSSDAIDRILVAVGEKFVPVGLDKRALMDDINKALATQRQIDRFRPLRARKCSKDLQRIDKALGAAASLLAADNDATRSIVEIAPKMPQAIDHARIVVEAIKRRLENSIKVTSSRYPNRVPTAIEWLVAVELPCIYEEHIHRKAAVSRGSSRKPGGPTVRFIEAVLREIGEAYSAPSIVRAMTRLASLRKQGRDVRRA
jgi:hypothetical protein